MADMVRWSMPSSMLNDQERADLTRVFMLFIVLGKMRTLNPYMVRFNIYGVDELNAVFNICEASRRP